MVTAPVVVVKVDATEAVIASVRDSCGIADVDWRPSTGWCCSCGRDACLHVEAVALAVNRAP